MMKTNTEIERKILKNTAIADMKKGPPMMIQINPMMSAAIVLMPFKSKKTNPIGS